MDNVLLVGSDHIVAKVISTYFSQYNYSITACDTVEQAQSLIELNNFKLLIVDIEQVSVEQIKYLRSPLKTLPSLPIIILTDSHRIENVIEAMKSGAIDYIIKPFKLQALLNLASKALSKKGVAHGKIIPINNIKPHFGSIIGGSPEILHVCSLIEKVSATDVTVLIQGESGTGKELVAKAIHDSSPRSKNSFIPLNCSAIPESLLESELFGHVKGAFTGANENRDGLFLSANKGTVFLDEINSMDLSLQSKLLRVLQERQVKRVGDDKAIDIDVRIIAACNEPLIDKKKSGEFREDLFYRICIVPIDLPPLRRRVEDIPLLIDYFCKKESENLGKEVTLSDNAMNGFMHYSWPGNIRELQNAISCSAVLSPTGRITKHDLPPHIASLIREDEAETALKNNEQTITTGLTLKKYLRIKEKEYIRQVLVETGNNRTRAAKILGIGRASLYRKLEE